MKYNYIFNFLICGANTKVAVTTTKVIHPPKITEGTVPISLAASPLSKAPISFDEEIKIRELENLEINHDLPNTSSLLSAQNAIIADLYRDGDQIEALILDYNLTDSATLQAGGQLIPLPQSMFTLMPLSPSSLKLPLQK